MHPPASRPPAREGEKGRMTVKKLINLLRGYVEIQVTGAFPERLLNLCAQHRLRFWRLEWLDEATFTFRVALADLGRLEELARRALCELRVLARGGAERRRPS